MMLSYLAGVAGVAAVLERGGSSNVKLVLPLQVKRRCGGRPVTHGGGLLVRDDVLVVERLHIYKAAKKAKVNDCFREEGRWLMESRPRERSMNVVLLCLVSGKDVVDWGQHFIVFMCYRAARRSNVQIAMTDDCKINAAQRSTIRQPYDLGLR